MHLTVIPNSRYVWRTAHRWSEAAGAVLFAVVNLRTGEFPRCVLYLQPPRVSVSFLLDHMVYRRGAWRWERSTGDESCSFCLFTHFAAKCFSGAGHSGGRFPAASDSFNTDVDVLAAGGVDRSHSRGKWSASGRRSLTGTHKRGVRRARTHALTRPCLMFRTDTNRSRCLRSLAL